ncbi:MAG: WxL domain-containing protein, partial [Streptococcaceae bacterium]|nr:WxL domain-containing protein [Streptococcaceae bacterium]
MKVNKTHSLVLAATLFLPLVGGFSTSAQSVSLNSTGSLTLTSGTVPTSPLNPEALDLANPVTPLMPNGSAWNNANGVGSAVVSGEALSIDFASSLSFGQQQISNQTKT